MVNPPLNTLKLIYVCTTPAAVEYYLVFYAVIREAMTNQLVILLPSNYSLLIRSHIPVTESMKRTHHENT